MTTTTYQPPAAVTQVPLVGTPSAALSIERVNYTHDAMIDLILSNPAVSQNALAKAFGLTPVWVSRVRNSDAFLARLAQRKAEIVDPALVLSVEERLRAVASKSLDVVLEKLEAAPSLDQALAAGAMATKALGYGARQTNVSMQASFVVAMPAKAESASAWASKHAPAPVMDVTEAVVNG